MPATNVLPLWVQYLQAFSLLFIAGIGAWIAFRQMQIAALKLEHDLYDKRYAVFEATRKMLAEVVTHANLTMNDFRSFVLGTGDAVFLFDDQLAEYLDEMRKHTSKLIAINHALESMPVSDQRTKAVDASSAELQWLVAQLESLSDKFKPYLRLSRRQRSSRRSWGRLLPRWR